MNTTPRKRNMAGYTDEQGRFRPIRSPKFVGVSKRKATTKDRKKYSRAKAGDLGKRKQTLAREDVFDREIRLKKEAEAKHETDRQKEWERIKKETAGVRSDGRVAESLMQFVRSSGGIRRTYMHRGRKVRGKRTSYDAGEIDQLSFKQTGKRGLTTDKGGKTLDKMYQAAREAGYPVSDMWDLISRVDDEARGGAPTYPTHGYLDYRDNPAMKRNPHFYIVRDGKRWTVVNREGVPVKAWNGRKVSFATKAAAEKRVKEWQKVSPEIDYAVRNPTAGGSRAHIASEAELKALRSVTRKLSSRIVNGKPKRNPVGWFRDVSPVTPDAVKKLYRKLAAQWHPDKAGGDVRKMQQINADYEKAIKIASGNEGNAHRASAERSAAKPLREAIEFAVTLPDDVNVVIRGLWLWLEGNTYKAREQIKSFKSSDGNKFKWASKKKAWFFAAVPSSNRGREYSFDEIDAMHGRELVNERKRRLGLRANPKKRNPDPLSTFTTAAVGLASALQIKEYVDAKKQLAALERKKRKKNGRTPAQSIARAKNPTRETEQQKEARRLLKGLIAQIKEYPSRDVVGSARSLLGYLPARARATAERHIEAARKAGSKKHPGASGAVRNPKPAAKKNPTLAEINRCRRIVAAADRENANWVDVPIIRERNPSHAQTLKRYHAAIQRYLNKGGLKADALLLPKLGALLGYTPAKISGDLTRAAAANLAKRKKKVNPGAKANPERCLKCRKMTPEGVWDLNGGFCDKCDKGRAKRLRITFPANMTAAEKREHGDRLRAAFEKVFGGQKNVRKSRSKKANPVRVPHRRTFSMFNGRPATKMKAMPVSSHAPARLDQLGDLIELKLTNGQVLKTNPRRFKLCAASGKLWITGGKFAKANPAEKANVLNPVAEIAHVVYGTTKPHHGDNSYTHYIHKLGEESGRRPVLTVDREGFPVIRGGNYTIEARGIVD